MNAANNCQTLQPYSYTPLKHNEIRLLHIKPASKLSDPVEATIVKRNAVWFETKDASPYLTWSYAWGPTFTDGSHLTHGIICDGKWFKTSRHLYDGLRRFRAFSARHGHGELRYDGLGLWVDAICINQADSNEKAEQVQMMGNIYRSSIAMIAWLGEADGLRDNASLSKFCAQTSESIPWLIASVVRQNKENALKQIMERPWFSRRWVVQEVSLTSKEYNPQSRQNMVLIGKHAFELSDLSSSLHRNFEALDGVGVRHHRTTHQSLTLLERLSLHQKAHCSSHHDLIYALMHASSDAERFGITVSYLSDVEDLFFQIAKVIICAPEGDWGKYQLLLLASSHPKMNETSKLPSWVPDWRTPARFLCAEQQELITTDCGPYGRSLLMGFKGKFEVSGRCVRVRGRAYPWRFHPDNPYCPCRFCRLWKSTLSIMSRKVSRDWSEVMANASRADCMLFSLIGFDSTLFILKKTSKYLAQWGLQVHRLVVCFHRPDGEPPAGLSGRMPQGFDETIFGHDVDVCIG